MVYSPTPVEFLRYEAELASATGWAVMAQLWELAKQGPVTLVFVAHDSKHSHAVVQRDLQLQDPHSRAGEQR